MVTHLVGALRDLLRLAESRGHRLSHPCAVRDREVGAFGCRRPSTSDPDNESGEPGRQFEARH